jgi:phosphate starvation-inducible protein PhoH and related proteins
MTKKQRRSFLRNLKKGQVDVNKHEHLEQAHKVIQLIQDYTVPTVSNPLKALTKAQSAYIKSIKNNLITFGCGPAGTGKTFVCGMMAADALANSETEKIIITRPVQEAGEHLGFLPGELEDKFAPYFRPFKDVLEERLGRGHVQGLTKAGRIEASPLAYMRGRSFKNCWIILDEAQNCTTTQMKLFLTRIGENCTVVVNGDITQRDIRGQCGLSDAMERLRHINGVSLITFQREDIVRSGIVQEVVEAYES